MQSICTVIVAMLAITGLAAAHAGHGERAHEAKEQQATAHPLPPTPALPPEGGLVGAVDLGNRAHTAHRSAAAKKRILQSIREYSRRFGPFSESGTRGTFEPFPIFPVGARESVDLIMNNYVDLDSSEGGIQDWNCGSYTYDGSYVDNGLLKSFNHQLIGVPVFAVLDGTVTDIVDSEPDQNAEVSNAHTNYIGIHHGEDRYTYYQSLKQDSAIVEVDQEVRAGEQIAMAASSGGGDWPGLAFSTWVPNEDDGWDYLEPYTGDCNPGPSGWENQIDIPVDPVCRDFGISTTNLTDFYSNDIYSWRPPTEGFITLDHDLLWMWTQSTDVGPFSTYQMEFYNPLGVLSHDTGTQWFNSTWNTYRYFHTYFAWDLDGLHTMPGTWTVNMIVNGEPYIDFSLEVLESGETLANRSPEPIIAGIGPLNATADDILTCSVYAQPVDDLDWDLVRYQYIWSIGGQVVRNTISAGQADHLPRLEGCDGAVVQCLVFPSDDEGYALPFTAKVRLAGESTGDCNCDGSVDILDLLVVLNEWGPCSICSGDLNQDANVDIFDLLAVISAWGS
ncbi:MAG: peptidoglycan DD-metalloendopeptidase family protein [Phycisphaerales bacterium]|nr:peptidoglycan DD-metalloendopeptidase family protein [Phycisphaerales bacterium]